MPLYPTSELHPTPSQGNDSGCRLSRPDRASVCEPVLFLTGMLGFDIACCFEEKRAGDWSGNPVITATPPRDANATRNDLVLAA